MKELEILAPAGSYEIFKAVLNAGADAVYVGGNRFGARAYANNFSEEELLRAIDEAHIHGRKLYLTVNTLMKEEELEKELYPYLLPYYRQGLDAVIVQDIGVFSYIREAFPGLDIHTSTQMTICNRYGAEMMKQMGATRVVTAREMSLDEIRDIADNVDIEIESFVHGALCYCFSGQCLFSSMLGGRSGNRGRCAQPCRLPYEVYDRNYKKIKTEPYVLSPKDLCTIEDIPKLAASGIYSFKIEGRMKQAEYAAGVVSMYRKYADLYLESGKETFSVSRDDMRKIYDFGNRSGFTSGYYEKHNGKDMITFEKPNHTRGTDTPHEEKRSLCNQEMQEKISGKLTLSKDQPAILEIECKGQRVVTEGDIVQPALKQPLLEQKIRENITKTGNTPFLFENLSVEMKDAVFLPMKSINQLRRDALEELEKKMVLKYRRTESKNVSYTEKDADCKEIPEQIHLSVSVSCREQIEPLLKELEVDDIYLESGCYEKQSFFDVLTLDTDRIHKCGKKAYFVFPSVFRKQTSDFYLRNKAYWENCSLDGIVVKSYDALQFSSEYMPKLPVILDAGIYTFNNRSIHTLQKLHPLRVTAPLELNRKELMRRENAGSEIIIYGYLPLMTSAQCVHANTGKCDKKPTVTYLKDRYGKYFPVRNHCQECYNTIYNSTPLVLFHNRQDFKRAGFHCFRLSFTVETKQEVENILSVYKEVFEKQSKTLGDVYHEEYTNGHYKRGVE